MVKNKIRVKIQKNEKGVYGLSGREFCLIDKNQKIEPNINENNEYIAEVIKCITDKRGKEVKVVKLLYPVHKHQIEEDKLKILINSQEEIIYPYKEEKEITEEKNEKKIIKKMYFKCNLCNEEIENHITLHNCYLLCENLVCDGEKHPPLKIIEVIKEEKDLYIKKEIEYIFECPICYQKYTFKKNKKEIFPDKIEKLKKYIVQKNIDVIKNMEDYPPIIEEDLLDLLIEYENYPIYDWWDKYEYLLYLAFQFPYG